MCLLLCSTKYNDKALHKNNDLLPCPASPSDLQKPVHKICHLGGGGGGGEVQYSDRAHDA